ncbi:MAG: hypothetical protein A2231_11820 [Candidatus Firestonebacteria bacterium RIFOXYA2_FULL_40_8]|nr:MAG: hypothetical protein A2231_11820 [Candidatus Firestonebacteria bacterium RIFOXYA2_FULL_40_8]
MSSTRQKNNIFVLAFILIFVFTGYMYCEQDEQQGQQGKQEQQGQQEQQKQKEKEDKDKKDKQEKDDKEKKDKEKKEKDEKEKKEEEKQKEDKKDDNKKPADKIIIKKNKIGGSITGNSNTDYDKKNEKRDKKKHDNYYYETEEEDDSNDGLSSVSQDFEGTGSSNWLWNLNLRYNLTFAVKYSLLGTYLSSYMDSNYFTGQWKGDMLFTGSGGEASFTIMGLGQRNIGAVFSLGYFEHRTVTNTFSDSTYTTVESSELKLLIAKVEVVHYPVEWFFVKGGVGGFYYSINTNVATNMPGYTYTGLEGNTVDVAFTGGIGVDFKIMQGCAVTIGVEGSIFVYDQYKVKGLRDGLMPYVGVSFLW